MFKKYSLLLLATVIMTGAFAQSQALIGTWKTIDDATGKAKSIVKLYIKNDRLYGDIIKLINDDPNYDPLCTECTGKLKDKKILGMTIVYGLKNNGKAWKGDDGIMDPDNGKYYDVKMWRDGNKLNVRGYIGPFYRTQTWYLMK